MKGFDSLQSLPTWALVAIGAIVVVDLVLYVWALTDLYRRPLDRVALGNKWVWAAIILLISTFGAIIYLIVGRKPAPVAETAMRGDAAARGASAADALYGAPKGIDPR